MNKGYQALGGRVRQLKRLESHELMELLGAWVELPADWVEGGRKRLFTRLQTFWLFLSHVLAQDKSCRATVRKWLARLALRRGRTASPNTAGYCKGRSRLRLEWLQRAAQGILEKIQAAGQPIPQWYGRTVKVVDGSSLSMPDTKANASVYPQPTAQKPGCGFPVMRIVGVFSLTTGVLLGLAKESLKISEQTLFRRLWELLRPGDVLLADRGFCSYANLYLLSRQGVDSVLRQHARRSSGVKPLRRLGPGDRIVQWIKTNTCPKWLDRKSWRRIPATLTLREITFTVDLKGFRSESITVISTLLDPREFPKEAFVQLYRRRWAVELYLRDIKITLGMDVLRCKTPEMIHKELQMYLIAYNLIRALMIEAAGKHAVAIERISFKGTLTTILGWAPCLGTAPLSQSKRQLLISILLSYLVRDLLPERPGRIEPRARKRRPKNYALLTKPRHLFREIPHRSRYKKPLS